MDPKDFANNFVAMKRAQVENVQLNKVDSNVIVPGVITVNLIANFLTGNYSDVSQLMPAGLTSLPNINDMACIQNLGVGQSNPYIVGYNRTQLLDIVNIFQAGEASLHSNNYSVNVQNEALKVNYSKVKPQVCQLPIGEGYVVVSLDFIAQFEKLVAAHNALVDVFNNHVHSGVQTGGGSTAEPSSQGDSITIDDNITTDKNYLASGKALISETGVNVPH